MNKNTECTCKMSTALKKKKGRKKQCLVVCFAHRHHVYARDLNKLTHYYTPIMHLENSFAYLVCMLRVILRGHHC